jgi:hypothetical protein
VLGEEPFTKIIKDEIKTFSYPVSFFAPYMSDANVKSLVNNFLDGTALCIQDYLQAMCHNKGRQRRKLGALLPDLSDLYKKSENFDNMLHAYLSNNENTANHMRSFSCWVLFITVEVRETFTFSFTFTLVAGSSSSLSRLERLSLSLSLSFPSSFFLSA